MKSSKIIRRRSVVQITFGVAATAALAACGGGGGDDSSNVNLREAFYKIQDGMTKEEVRAVVGRSEDGASPPSWTEGGAILWVFFQRNEAGISVANDLRLDADGKTILRDLSRGE